MPPPEVLRAAGSAAVILDERRHVLLVKHSYGRLTWESPGGLAESYESAVQTAVREVREETGLAVATEQLTGLYYETTNDMHHFVFLCVPEDVSAAPQPDEGEITQCGYWPADALPRPISDFTIRRIQDALSDAAHYPLQGTVDQRQWFE